MSAADDDRPPLSQYMTAGDLVNITGPNSSVLVLCCVSQLTDLPFFVFLHNYSQEICWEEPLRNDLLCVDRDVKTLTRSRSQPVSPVANVLLHQQWPLGSALCPLIGYAQAVSVFLGAFTLVAISVDRHRAIRHPLRARLTARQLIGAFVVIWTAALALPSR